MTRSSGILIDDNQSTLQEQVPEEVEPAPEQVAAPALEPVVAPTTPTELEVSTPPVEVVVLEESQQVPTPAESSSRKVTFPHRLRIFKDEELNETWGRISDRQAVVSPDSTFAEYNNMAIEYFVENVAVARGLTQRIKILQKKNSALENLKKIKEEVMAKEVIIAKLQEECQNKGRSIEYLTTRHKEDLNTFEKKNEEQTQALRRAEKALEFEHGKEAAFGKVLKIRSRPLTRCSLIWDRECNYPI